jgi:hypothetical protein
MSAIKATLQSALLYASGVFASGFALGAIRTMFLVPLWGELAGVLVELPIILTISWVLCGKATLKLQVPISFAYRLLMGLSAFAILLAAEYVLWFTFFSNSGSASFTAKYGTAAGAVGLAGQMLFALFPLLQAQLSIRAAKGM